MRGAYLHVLTAFVGASHKSDMHALKQALITETWAAVPAASGGDGAPWAASCGVGSIAHQLARAAEASSVSSNNLAAFGEPGFNADMEAWMQLGNPFRSQGSKTRATGGKVQGAEVWFAWQALDQLGVGRQHPCPTCVRICGCICKMHLQGCARAVECCPRPLHGSPPVDCLFSACLQVHARCTPMRVSWWQRVRQPLTAAQRLPRLLAPVLAPLLRSQCTRQPRAPCWYCDAWQTLQL